MKKQLVKELAYINIKCAKQMNLKKGREAERLIIGAGFKTTYGKAIDRLSILPMGDKLLKAKIIALQKAINESELKDLRFGMTFADKLTKEEEELYMHFEACLLRNTF